MKYLRISEIPHPPSLSQRIGLFTHDKHLFPDEILDILPNRLLLSRSLFEIFSKTSQSNRLYVDLIQDQTPGLL